MCFQKKYNYAIKAQTDALHTVTQFENINRTIWLGLISTKLKNIHCCIEETITRVEVSELEPGTTKFLKLFNIKQKR